MNGDNDHYLDIPDYENTVPTDAIFLGVLEGHHYSPDEPGGSTTLTYSFAGPGSKYDTGSYAGDGRNWPTLGLERLSNAEIVAFETVLEQVKAYTNLEFTRVEDTGEQAGTIRLAWFSGQFEDFAAYADAPYPAWPAAGDIWFAKNAFEGATLTDFTGTAIHEFGHTVGLKHPHETRGAFISLSADWDGREYSIMSYKMSAEHPTAVGTNLGPQTFMYLDILALQYLYGADTVTTAGNETYSYSQKARHYLTIWDAGGTDTLEVTDGSRSVILDLTPGTWSNVGSTIQYDTGHSYIYEQKTVFIPPEVLIENAIGAGGNDVLTGNHVANSLKGNDGRDTLYGKDGDDFLVGGDSHDKLYGGSGNDALWAGAGDTGNDTLIGGAGNDALGGGAGNDLLTGDDEATASDGHDTLSGGLGNDTLIGGGWLDGGAKNGIFDPTEATQSGTKADKLWAGEGDDIIIAAGGSDTIGTGAGDDTIEAGGGNDRIFAYSGNDSVSAEDGNDLIYSGPGADSVTGGTGNDTLWGGSGDDTLTGGDGSDTFSFTADSGKDIITDFDVNSDDLQLSGTVHTFSNSADVIAKAEDTDAGVIVDLGGEATLLLARLTTSNLDQLNLASD